MSMSRTQLGFLAIVVVVGARLMIGWHFFKEGSSKLRDGNWSAAPVFRMAKGDLAPVFKSMAPGKEEVLHSLFVTDAEGRRVVDTKNTVEAWWTQSELLANHYNFGDPELEQELKRIRAETRQEILDLREERRKKHNELKTRDADVNDFVRKEADDELTDEDQRKYKLSQEEFERTRKEFLDLDQQYRQLEQKYKQQEQEILTVRYQRLRAVEVADAWEKQLNAWVADYENEIDEYLKFLTRTESNSNSEMREQVYTLSGQSKSIEKDFKSKQAPLIAGLTGLWMGFNQNLNALAIPAQQEKYGEFAIRLPSDPSPRLEFIDSFIPWFDTIIGALLILGLFVRPAALAAAAFLFGVICMQLPWAAGAMPTYYQAIEMFALLMLAAIGAGRYAGLDFFLRCIYFQCFPPKQPERQEIAHGTNA